MSDAPPRLDCRVVLVRPQIAGNLGARRASCATWG